MSSYPLTARAETSDGDVWLYDPSLPLAVIFTILYLIPTIWQLYQTVFKYKTYYFLVVFIGGVLEVAGYIIRIISIRNKSSIPPFAIQSTFIILAPLFVSAGNYLLITRLCVLVLHPTSTRRFRIFGIPITHLTKIFVCCDMLTFLIQASGSGIASSSNWEGSSLKAGENVLIGGLALQLVTFGCFLVIVARFDWISRRQSGKNEGQRGWRKGLNAVYISSGLIIIRCVYRLVEFALGIFGYPFTHEWMFYVFESVPMVPAIAVFCLWHPGRYLRRDSNSCDAPMVAEETNESVT